MAGYLTPVDALQIAIASSIGPDTTFVSTDGKLNEVAHRQGLLVLNTASAE